LIGLYWAVLFVLDIGFCVGAVYMRAAGSSTRSQVLLVTARKIETQHLLVSGIGLRFVRLH
jgi:hypothetical protein